MEPRIDKFCRNLTWDAKGLRTPNVLDPHEARAHAPEARCGERLAGGWKALRRHPAKTAIMMRYLGVRVSRTTPVLGSLTRRLWAIDKHEHVHVE